MKFQSNSLAVFLCILACGGWLFTSAGISSADVTLGWDPNSEDGVEGYGVYTSMDSPGPPFEHLGDVFVDELPDPDNPTVILTEIDNDGIYYFAATAFDSQGNESNYSEQLCVEVSGGSISGCTTVKSAADATSGGGGGGGG